MQGLFRRAAASIVALCLLAPQIEGVSFASPHRAPQHTSVALASPPQRIPVKEPVRTKAPALAMSALRPKTVTGVRAHGVHVDGPPMLRPSEIDRVISAARRRTPAAAPAKAMAPPVRTVPQPPSSGTRPGARHALSLPSAPTASGTGINPWWRYQEQNVPGGGHVMVNVGTGNMLLQDDDMSVPHKGIALAFRRTYNSQMPATIQGYTVSWQSLYGIGWTNTFDAHMLDFADGSGGKSVYDVDGARYDYKNVGTITPVYVSTTPGQHATLVSDGVCGALWTKKSGTVYYFYGDNPAKTTCPGLTPLGGYAGRLYQIVGRNRNTQITFSYSWDNGDASVNGKISAITATTESGMTANLAFGDINGHRLLQQITFPDGATAVQYGYDPNGNLGTVSRPANNASGIRPLQSYGYQALGSDQMMVSAMSPRWNAGGQSSGGYGSDGGYLRFGYGGSDAVSSTLTSLVHGAVVNPTIPDGTNSGGIQSGFPTSSFEYLVEYYTTGTDTPTYRDTDGHMTNWIVDGVGRPTQTQECTASLNQGQQCVDTLHWLTTNESWDANNNLTAQTDPRGNETDYGYDANGNAVAVGEPQVVTSQGTFRPTKLYDYDGFNNVTAFCDETEAHAAGVTWSTALTGSDALCSTNDASGRHWRATYTNPSYQPDGELASMTTPLGYTRRFAYASSQQAGNDYGLPTSVVGDQFTQVDGTSITPTQTFWYDAAGYVRCYSKGQGTFVLSYDVLGRLTSEADPDDASANSGSLCGKGTGLSGWNTQTTYTYFADGAKQTSQTPVERANGVSTAYSYDVDGDETTETHHFGCTTGNTCTPGVTTKWYDGTDQLVEVAQPQDPSDLYTYPWLTRYLYDLTASGTVAISTASFNAHGNLFKTQEWMTGPGATSPSWTDLRGNAFDALDRTIAKYTFSPSANTTLSTATSQYDASKATLGLLAFQTDPLGEATSFTYDALGRVTDIAFAGDGGVTPQKSYVFDPSGRQAIASGAAYGSQVATYDLDGRVTEVDESRTGSVSSPARLTYDYYPDGDRKDLNVASDALNAAPLLTYTRRSDGILNKESILYQGVTNSFTWTYTDGGRELTQIDPYTGTAMPAPQSPVNPGTFYVPTTWSYDVSGHMTSVGLPETLNYSEGYDFEGHLSYWYVSAAGSSSFAAGTTFYNTSRGENFQQVMNPPSGAFLTRPANGALVPGIKRASPLPAWGSAPVLDPINAVVTGSNLTGSAIDSINGMPIPCGTLANIDSYDGASRLVTRPANGMNPDSNGNCNIEDNLTYTWSYDAENHTIAQLVGTAQWGPTEQPYNISGSGINDSLHYDGATLLFVTDVQGHLSNIKLGELADIAPGGQVTVWDRDTSSLRVTGHNNTLYYGVAFGGRQFGPFRGGEGPGSLIPGVVSPIIFKGSTTAPGCTLQSCSIGGRYAYSRTEGFDWGNLTIQGARVVDNATGQWTTPDAFAGQVDDPMSQKPYMWNRNNPYEYSDSTGYYPCGSSALASGAVASEVTGLSSIGCVSQPPHSGANPQSAAPTAQQAAEDLESANVLLSRNAKDFLPNSMAILGALGGGAGRPATEAAGAAASFVERAAIMGSRRSPMKVFGNAAEVIGGRKYSGHAIDRMQGRGLFPSVVEDIIGFPAQTGSGKNATTFFENLNGFVLLNSNGDVVTVWPK